MTATTGGIGTGGALGTITTGTLTLTSGGEGSAGDINIAETNALSTSNVNFSTTGNGIQTFNLTAPSFNINNAFGNANDDLLLTANTGSISDAAGSLTANDLILSAIGNNQAIGSMGADAINVILEGVLKASASNGTGGIYINSTDTLEVGYVNAGPGDVNLKVAGAILDGSTGVDTTVNIIGATVRLEGYSVAGAGIEDLDVTVATQLNVNTTGGPGDIFIESTGDMPVGDITAGTGNDVNLKSGGDIVMAGSMITSENLTLEAMGGIGEADSPIETNTSKNMQLSTNSPGNNGDIYIVETNALNTNRISISTHSSRQLVSLTTLNGDITIDGDIGNATDDLTLIADAGNIVSKYDGVNRSNVQSDPNYLDWDNIEHSVIMANDLVLIVKGENARIGKQWSETNVEGMSRYEIGTEVPVMVRVNGTLTIDASNGNGGIFLEVPEFPVTADKYANPDLYAEQYAKNSITFDSIDAGEDGNIGITLNGSLNGNIVPIGYDNITFLPVYENNADYDYNGWREDAEANPQR